MNLDICKCPGSPGSETLPFYQTEMRQLTELQLLAPVPDNPQEPGLGWGPIPPPSYHQKRFEWQAFSKVHPKVP